MTTKSFAFAGKNDLPLYYVSAADGTNVVQMFRDAIDAAVKYKDNPTDIDDQILEELDNFHFDPKGDDKENNSANDENKEN